MRISSSLANLVGGILILLVVAGVGYYLYGQANSVVAVPAAAATYPVSVISNEMNAPTGVFQKISQYNLTQVATPNPASLTAPVTAPAVTFTDDQLGKTDIAVSE